MENNNEFNKKVLERLQNKIAIEQFKNENIKEKTNIIKTFSVSKIAAIITASSLLLGNIATYATCEENLFVWAKNLILNKVGIAEDYEKEKIDLENVFDYNGITLTIKDYGIDNNNFIIGYSIVFPNKIEFAKKTISSTQIINDDKIYDLSNSGKSVFTKISDKEYFVYEMYDIDSAIINENSLIKENMKLYDSLYDVDDKVIADWSFDIKIDSNKLKDNLKKYSINDNVIIEENKNERLDTSFSKIEISDIATKLYMKLNDYYTEPSRYYTVEILDTKGNVLLSKDSENLIGGVFTSIIFKKIDINQKIIVNIYEEFEDEDSIKITAQRSYKLDLNKATNFEKDIMENINLVKFYDLSFDCWQSNEEFEENMKDLNRTEIQYVYLDLKDFYENISIIRYENINKYSLDTVAEKIKLYEQAGGFAINDGIAILNSENEFVSVTDEQFEEFVKKGYIDISGERIYVDKEYLHDVTYMNEEKTNIDGYKAIKWVQQYGTYTTKYILIVDDYIYEINCPNNIEIKDYVEHFINSIKIKHK